MSLILRWTIPPPFVVAKVTQIGHSGPKSNIVPIHGTYDVYYVKNGSKKTKWCNNGKSVKGQGQCDNYFVVNGMKGLRDLTPLTLELGFHPRVVYSVL